MDRAGAQCPCCAQGVRTGIKHLCQALPLRSYTYDVLLMTKDHPSPMKSALDAEVAAAAAAEEAAEDPLDADKRAAAAAAASKARKLLRASNAAAALWVEPDGLPMEDVLVSMQLRQFGGRCAMLSEAGVITLYLTNSHIKVTTPQGIRTLVGFKVLQPAWAVLDVGREIIRYWGVPGGPASVHNMTRSLSGFNIRQYIGLGLAISWTSDKLCLDPTWSGNLAVMTNHSCVPNVVPQYVLEGGQIVMKLVLSKPVTGSEELFWDYGCTCDTPAEVIPCCCGSGRSCRGNMCDLTPEGEAAAQNLQKANDRADRLFCRMSSTGQQAARQTAALVAEALAAEAKGEADRAAAPGLARRAEKAARKAAAAEEAVEAAKEPRKTRSSVQSRGP